MMENNYICDSTLLTFVESQGEPITKKNIMDYLKDISDIGLETISIGQICFNDTEGCNVRYSIEEVMRLHLPSNTQKYMITYKLDDYNSNFVFPENIHSNLIVRVEFTSKHLAQLNRVLENLIHARYQCAVCPLYYSEFTEQDRNELFYILKKHNIYAIYYHSEYGGAFKDWSERCNINISRVRKGIVYNANIQNINITEAITVNNIDYAYNILRDGYIAFPYRSIKDRKFAAIKRKVRRAVFDYLNSRWGNVNLHWDIGRELCEDLCIRKDYSDIINRHFSPEYEAFEDILMSIKKDNIPDEEDLIRKYVFGKLKIRLRFAVVILTSNRPKCIECWLAQAGQSFERYGADIVIYDSSDTDFTERIVHNYKKNRHFNAVYKRYNGKWDGFSLDDKYIAAVKEFGKEYDYLWIMRDGLIGLADELMRKIIPIMRENIPLMVVNAKARDIKNIGNKTYTDVALLFKEQCHTMTIWGGTIAKSDFLMDVIKTIPLDEEKNYGLYEPLSVLQYIADKNIVVKSVVGDIYTFNNGSPAASFWQKNTFIQWGDLWYRHIMSLPDVYSKYKYDVLKITMSDFHPFSIFNLIRIRASGSGGLNEVRKYWDIIPYVTDTNRIFFIIIAFIPKLIAKQMSVHYDGKFMKRLRNKFHSVEGRYDIQL